MEAVSAATMATDRYRSPGSSRDSSRKKRRYHYKQSPEPEKYSDIDSRSSSGSISSGRSTHVPAPAHNSITSSSFTRQHRPANNSLGNNGGGGGDEGEGEGDDARARRRRAHSSHGHRKPLRQQHHHHHHHHRRKALPAPDEEYEKAGAPTTVAIREEYPVQTVPRTHQREPSPDEEEVHDHRPRPLSRRQGTRHPERRRAHSEPQRANAADQGFFMAAVMVLVGLFICLGEADE